MLRLLSGVGVGEEHAQLVGGRETRDGALGARRQACEDTCAPHDPRHIAVGHVEHALCDVRRETVDQPRVERITGARRVKDVDRDGRDVTEVSRRLPERPARPEGHNEDLVEAAEQARRREVERVDVELAGERIRRSTEQRSALGNVART